MDKALKVAYTVRNRLSEKKVCTTRDKYFLIDNNGIQSGLLSRGCMGPIAGDANAFRSALKADAHIKYLVIFPQIMRVTKYAGRNGPTEYRSVFVDKKLDEHMPIGSSEEHADYFLDYILNRSPWAPVFITKDPEDVRTKGLIIDANNELTLIVTATIAVRTLCDYPDFAYNFYRIRQLLGDKYPENLQYILSALLLYGEGYKVKKVIKRKIPVWNIYSTHYKGYGNPMWFKNLTPSGVRNFLSGTSINNGQNFLSSNNFIDRYKLFVRTWQTDGPQDQGSYASGNLPVIPDIALRSMMRRDGSLGATTGYAYENGAVADLAKKILKYSTSKRASK